MADNVAITAGAGTTIAADDVGGVLFQRVKVTWGVDGTATDASASNPLPITAVAGENHLGEVGGVLATPSANFTRPADTTAYALGDLVANSTTAGSVTPLSWTAARVAAGSFLVRRARAKKSGTSVTNASFRLHLYSASPTCTNGDNGAWLTTVSGYLASIDLDMSSSNGRVFSDAAAVNGTPNVGSDLGVKLASGQTMYGLLECRAAYTPGNAEVFTVELELLQN